LARAEVDPRIGVVAPADYTLILARAALIPRWAENPEPAKRFIDFLLSEEGRQQLAEASLIVSFGSSEEGGSPLLSGGPSTLHPIAFSPALLVGLDRQKREIFLDLWRSSVGGIGE
jgi:ABC-type Fe3+ transport system substrate-binding protein